MERMEGSMGIISKPIVIVVRKSRGRLRLRRSSIIIIVNSNSIVIMVVVRLLTMAKQQTRTRGNILLLPCIAWVKDKEIVIIGKPDHQTPVGEHRGVGRERRALPGDHVNPWDHGARELAVLQETRMLLIVIPANQSIYQIYTHPKSIITIIITIGGDRVHETMKLT